MSQTALVTLVLVGGFMLRAQAPPGEAGPVAPAEPRIYRPALETPGPSVANPYSGSVPRDAAVTASPLPLTLQDAIQRGLRFNLGLLLGNENVRSARAGELRARSALLPTISGRISQTEEQVNLAAFGFRINFPGIPKIVGPFHVFDARALLSAPLLDLASLFNARAGAQNVNAAELNYRDSRDIVAQVVADAYLQVLADGARLDEARAEVTTAQALYQKALDLKNAGVSPAIDALRAQVELQAQQTRLRALENDQAKDRLGLARVIGLPVEQAFTLADNFGFAPLTSVAETQALDRALSGRPDYQAALAQVRAAELAHRAARAERLPSLSVNADYGSIGETPISNHGTFNVTGAVHFPIFDGGRIRADVEQADAALEQTRAAAGDLRERIHQQIRNAFLDLQTAADQVSVGRSSVDLAKQALTQAQDRFSAGVADNIEVVQAQNALTNATDNYISAVYAHNFAKVEVARAMGQADQNLRQLLTEK